MRERQRFYVPFYEGTGDVLDLGCGRGEFLEADGSSRNLRARASS